MAAGAAIGAARNGAGAGVHGHGATASQLGALNAAHASPTALAHAAPNSRVGMIASYDSAMTRALAMPSATPAQRAARNSAISQARAQLATASNKPVTASVARAVDRQLGLAPAPYGR